MTTRFETDPDALVPAGALPEEWRVAPPSEADIDALTALLRAHEQAARGWAGSDRDDVAAEVLGPARVAVCLRDDRDAVRAWAAAHDRAEGRMLLAVVVDRSLDEAAADRAAHALLGWGRGQARAVGLARGRTVQQIDTGSFADDSRQAGWLSAAGFEQVRSWWQMSRPVGPEEAALVPDPAGWSADGVRVRLVRRDDEGRPDAADLLAVHQVLERSFVDHFNSWEETFAEFVVRLADDPGHDWDHWWLAELEHDRLPGVGPVPVGALLATRTGAPGSYVAYLGVLDDARGRGVAKRLLNTVVADAATRGRVRVGLEVDADSPTGADGLYRSMGWKTDYVTCSWHLDLAL